MKKKYLIDKYPFVKFLIVGVINTLVGDGLIFLLYNLTNIGYWGSSIAGYIVGGTVSFFLNKDFTFKYKHREEIVVIKYITNILICYVIAYGIGKRLVAYILIDKLTLGLSTKVLGNLTIFFSMCLYTLLNYAGQKRVVFLYRDNK